MRWTFVINKDFYFDLKKQNKIKWNTAKEVKKGDIIFIYTGSPYSSIGFILKAISDPFEDSEIRNNWDMPAIMVEKLLEITEPIELSELRKNSILSDWSAVKMGFRGSHFKMSEEESEELKKLIIADNIKLKKDIENLDNRKVGIRYFIEKMLKNYIKAKNNPNLAKELVRFANGGDFHEYLIKIANEFEKGDYGTLGAFGASNNLQWIPYIYIHNKKYHTWLITFLFREDMKGVYLSICQHPWNLDGKINEKGLIQKYSYEFNNCLLKDSKEARTKLKNLTTIPEDYLEKIDLGSNNAISAASREAGNVYAKYYTLDNLPSEEDLISDFKETFDLYKKLAEPNISEEVNIKEPLEFIFRNLKIVKQKNQKPKDHEVSKAFLEIKNNILRIANDIYPEIDYNSVAYYQAKGKWSKLPYIYIENKAHKDIFDHWDQHYVGFMFTEDLNGVYLSLNQSGTYAHAFLNSIFGNVSKGELEEYLKKHGKSIRNQLEEFVTDEFMPEHSKKAAFNDKIIYGKYYDKKELPDNEEILSDFKFLLKLYLKLEPDITETTSTFSEYLQEKKFLYTPEMVENFLLSLLVKPFVILTGSSGTGKTKIAQLFAEYLKGKNMADYVIIPVGANWTENRHLMGFYNVITRDYESTPALDLITDAHNNPDKTYFLILDEMNLSHVERYFSDFLSAMESGKEIELYSKHKAEAIKNKIIPQKLKIPDNLLVVGTVNVDETTYMFSPKVLDRANTIEFSTYPANDYIMCIIEHHDLEGNMDLLENPLSYLNNRDINISRLKDLLIHVQIKNGDNLWTTLAREIHNFQDTLKLAGFDFGFRVINEILRFMYMAWLYEGSPPVWDNWERYFDAQIMQKMLPKIHGSQRELEVLLKKLFKLTYNGPYTDKPWVSLTLDEDKCKYPSSALKIQSLGRSLQEKRYASFTG